MNDYLNLSNDCEISHTPKAVIAQVLYSVLRKNATSLVWHM
jgi:hypothetical protein